MLWKQAIVIMKNVQNDSFEILKTVKKTQKLKFQTIKLSYKEASNEKNQKVYYGLNWKILRMTC